MVYSVVADFAKNIAHLAIDSTFPRTAPIATIAGWISWRNYNQGMVEFHKPLHVYLSASIDSNLASALPSSVYKAMTFNNFISIGGELAYPLTAKLVPYAALCYSIASACAVSFGLNLLHLGMVKVHECWRRVFFKESLEAPRLNGEPEYRKGNEDRRLNVEPGYRIEAERSLLNVEPGYRREDDDLPSSPPTPAPPLKRTIEVPIYNPQSIHDIYLN